MNNIADVTLSGEASDNRLGQSVSRSKVMLTETDMQMLLSRSIRLWCTFRGRAYFITASFNETIQQM